MALIIAGVDEAGRGPLAGDVVAAAVILDPSKPIDGLNDSKKLSEKKRLYLFEKIKNQARCYAVARASLSEIDELNILHASMLAMKRAVESLSVEPCKVLVDGNRLPKWRYTAEAIIQGDSLVAEISAASILAKVTRDADMEALDVIYPGYGLAQHKGYPTKAHIEAIGRLGVSAIHRLSFGPVKQWL